jgi:hypothetical protein
MKKIITAVSLILLSCMLCLVVTSYDPAQKEKEQTSPIASLTATEESTTLKIGESILLTNFYKTSYSLAS